MVSRKYTVAKFGTTINDLVSYTSVATVIKPLASVGLVPPGLHWDGEATLSAATEDQLDELVGRIQRMLEFASKLPGNAEYALIEIR